MRLKLCLGVCVALACGSVYAEGTKQVDANQSKESVKSEQVVENLQDVNFYKTVKPTVSEDKQANKLFNKYYKSYEKYTKKVNSEMDRMKKDILSEINKEKDEGVKIAAEQQALYDLNCKEVKKLEEKEFNQCESIKENVFNINERIKSLDVAIKNQTNKIETDRINRLKKIYIDYKNIVGRLLVQVKNNHAEK